MNQTKKSLKMLSMKLEMMTTIIPERRANKPLSRENQESKEKNHLLSLLRKENSKVSQKDGDF